ncbi:MAG: hypothetical protein ABS79_07095 [Planctomycetes bacterium SCN 63-9]|nr:MAG: hypothetical protein ABS79_07095 [Planctomycetes bacterium SCN 63-9]
MAWAEIPRKILDWFISVDLLHKKRIESERLVTSLKCKLISSVTSKNFLTADDDEFPFVAEHLHQVLAINFKLSF